MHTRHLAVTVSLLLPLTACSGNGEPGPTVTVTRTVTATPTPKAAATPSAPLKMGTKVDIVEDENDLHITVQALQYQQPYKGPQPQKPLDFQGGDTWATINVKVCNVQGSDFTVSQFPWHLSYKDSTSIQVTGSTGGDMPKPEFPMDRTVKPGRCAAGLIAFPVPGDKSPERLVYEPDGTQPTEWAIG
ncbi:DUF4352 domain-containing protein [Streptomyces sp. TRM49041]|uniref:DUF4352 domain-containing protein n=1 Tax=Streptomyces sp. TRM49041 TaxID=2603216 RepID=UPI0011ED577E|nr:DUF4352 domain-containing protein [Streptomyces sp. TRM49041]